MIRCKDCIYSRKSKVCQLSDMLIGDDGFCECGQSERDGISNGQIADKYAWHDLRKNPEDLPRINDKFGISKQLMFIDSDKEPYIGYLSNDIGMSGHIYKRWYADFCDDKIKDVIAWREIEPFESEVEE